MYAYQRKSGRHTYQRKRAWLEGDKTHKWWMWQKMRPDMDWQVCKSQICFNNFMSNTGSPCLHIPAAICHMSLYPLPFVAILLIQSPMGQRLSILDGQWLSYSFFSTYTVPCPLGTLCPLGTILRPLGTMLLTLDRFLLIFWTSRKKR